MGAFPRFHLPFSPGSFTRSISGTRLRASRRGRLFFVLIRLAALLVCLPAAAQTLPNGMFARISLEQGLSNTTVTSILQDRRGFLWFATQEGLNRYDGFSFTIYKHDLQDSTSIGSNRILSLMEDRSGMLWIGTSDAGLDCYDRATGRFRHYRSRDGDPNSLSFNQVETIYEDRRGTIWAGTLDGLNRLDRKTGKITRYYCDRGNPRTLGSSNIGCIMEDSEGTLWIASADCLNRYVPASDSFVRYSPKDQPLYFIGSVLERKDGCFWLSSWGNGLWLFDRRTGQFSAIRNEPGDPKSLRCNYVGHLAFDPRGNLWVGTNEGLDLLPNGSGEFTHFTSDPLDDRSISTNGIWSLRVDRAGILWIGTYQGGLNKLVLPRAAFTHYCHDARNPKSLGDNKVITLFESRDGEIWIGTERGLNRFDRKTGVFTVLRHDPGNPGALGSDYVNTIWEDPRGILWIGTSGGGFCRFDRSRDSFRTYRAVPADSTRLPDDWVLGFFQEPRGRIWIGSYSGLTVFDPETERFSRFSPIFSKSADNASAVSVNTILRDGDHCYWIGSYIGLFRYDHARRELLRYASSPSDPETLSNDQVRSLYLDGKGRLWVGTALGLNRLDRATGKFTRYTRREGLSNEVINGISADSRGNIWVTTNGAISRLDPETGEIANFDADDGVPFSVFNERALLRARDGSFFVGGTGGFFSFHPDSLRPVSPGPPMAITSFRIFNREIDTGGTPVSELKRVVLSRRDTFFSLEFAALDYSAPSRNIYAYRMDGFDRDWVQAGTRRYVSYTNLDPGKYVFRVKGANKDGIWSERDASLEIIILPPFWMTWWFRLLAGLLLAGSILGIYRVRTNSLRRKEKKLEDLVSTRTRELMEKQSQLVEKQEQLSRSEELYRGLVETSPDAILVTDPEGIIRMANPQASEMLAGRLGADLRGRALGDFLVPGQRERFGNLFRELRENGMLHNVTLDFEKGGDAFLPVELNALLIPDPEDLRCIGVLRDIRERRRAEEERVEKERLRGVVETAGGASHELNQPLQAIIGYAEILLLDRSDPSTAREYLKKIRREADRMGGITHKLMNITQFRTKRYVGDIRIIDLDRSAGDHRVPGEDGGE